MGKREFEAKLRAQLDEWEAEINRLRAKADVAEAKARVKYHEEIEELRVQKREAEARLEELSNSGDDAWEDMKAGMESAWKNLGDAVNRATARFK